MFLHTTMLTSPIVQRTNSASITVATTFSVLTLGAVSALCGVFLLTGWTLPDWVVLVGRWIPALVSLAVMRAFPLPGGVGRWWALRPGGWRRLLVGGLVGVGALLTSYALTVLVAGATGVAAPLPWAEIATLVPLLVPVIAVYSLSTFGEEVGWRGYLQQLLVGRGFWVASSLVAGVWVVFHVPLHATLALQGTLPAQVLVGTTLLLFPLGLLLSALVTRFGSVWPAVFAHALPLSALNLLQDPADLDQGSFWTITALSAATLVAAALLIAPRTSTPPAPSENRPS